MKFYLDAGPVEGAGKFTRKSPRNLPTVIGNYSEVSEKAAALNRAEVDKGDRRKYVYFPTPIANQEEVAHV